MQEIQRYRCKNCGGDHFYFTLYGSPSTPTAIMAVLRECCNCGTEVHTQVLDENCKPVFH